MTKKLIPAMVGVALAGGMTAAAADVTVFGHIDTAITNYDFNAPGPGEDDTNFVCTTCSIGFKGSEDLGNGLKVIFKLDWQYDTMVRNDGDGTGADGDNDNSGLLDRDQWLGMAGGFGKVRIGTISTHYKSHGAMIDPLYRTALQGRDHGLQSSFHRGAGEELQGRATNTLRYDSPNFNGLKAGFHYTLDSDETDGEDENPFGVGGSYENGGILVFADYMDNDQSGLSESSVWKIGGKYSLNNFAVMGQYEDEDYSVTGEYTQWHVAGTYTMGNNMIYAGFGNAEDEFGGLTVEDTDAWTIALMHSLSKRTKLYAGYNQQEDDVIGGIDYDEISLGVKHKF